MNNNLKNSNAVSICCITYNHEKYITQAIESILIQRTDFPIEVLIFDDASTDRTAKIIRSYEEKYPTLIKPIYQTVNQYSKGIKPTLKYNFPRAKGKYIAICEGDDYWTDPDKLQKQVDFLDSHPECAISFHAARFIYENGSQPSFDRYPPGRKTIYNLNDLLSGGNKITSCTVMFRNGLIREFPSWYYQMPMGDWPLHLLNAQYGDIVYIDEVMAIRRIHGRGMWSSLEPIEALEKEIVGYEIVRKNLNLTYQGKRNLSKALSKLNYRLAKAYIKIGDLSKAKPHIFKCILFHRSWEDVTLKRLLIMIVSVYSPKILKIQKDFRSRFS